MGKPSGNTIFDKTKIIIDVRKQIKTSELKRNDSCTQGKKNEYDKNIAWKSILLKNLISLLHWF